jgi:serine/threonine-protein kinase
MGEIYRAEDEELGRPVAIKALAERYAADVAIRRRFKREALAAARLSGDPHTVTIYDVGEADGRPFIVMEYLGGGSLESRLREKGPVEPAQGLRWLEQAAAALDAAHARGVVHRDVKPANLLLDADGNVHVADFGVASAAGLDSLTATGTVLGTAGYLSPEQARGERATPASDRYSLAVLAFELLTGERPFARDSLPAEAAAHVHSPVPSVCERRGSLPCELDDVFERALAKDPEQRFPTAGEFVQELRAALTRREAPTRVLPPTAPLAYVPARPRRGLGLPLVAAAVAVAGAGAALGALLADRGGGHPAATRHVVVRTVTTPARTVRETVVASHPVAAAPAPPLASGDGHSLNDRGYTLMQQGQFAQALPLLQQAVQLLQGSGPGDPYEGWSNYNLGVTLVDLGRCAAALPYLERAKRLEPQRKEVHRAIVRAKHCR